jgi:hypothetical protein
LLLRPGNDLLVIDRATGVVVHRLPFEGAFTRWDPERSDRFVVSEVGRITVVTFDRVSATRRVFAVEDFGGASLSGDRVCFAGQQTTGLLAPVDRRFPTTKGQLAMIVTGAHGLCYAVGSTKITVVGDIVPRELISPLQITKVVASRGNPYVIAAASERLVIWRVPPPAKHLLDTGPVSLWPIGAHGVVFGSTIEKQAIWNHVDLSTGRAQRIPLPPDTFVLQPVSSSAGDLVVFRDLARKRVIVVGLRSGKITIFDGDPPIVAANTRALVGLSDGRLVTVDEPGNVVEVLRSPKAPLYVNITPSSIAAAWSDGRLWLSSPAGARDIMVGKPIRDLLVDGDDVFVLTSDTTIERWTATGLRPFATTTLPVTILVTALRGSLVVALQGNTLARVDEVGEHRLVSGQNTTYSGATQRALVYRAADLELFELDIGTAWKIDVPASHVAPMLSSNGRWIALLADNALYAIELDLPETPAAVAARIELLTNGEVDRSASSAVIRWRD